MTELSPAAAGGLLAVPRPLAAAGGGKTLPLPCVFRLPSRLRRCLCLVYFDCRRG